MKKLLSLLLVLVMLVGLMTMTVNSADLPFTDVKADSKYYEGVKYVFEKGIMNGTSATAFSPDAGLTRGMIVTILHRLNGEPQSGSANFTDVPANAWFAKGVAWAASNGVVSGVGNGKFAPNDTLTREQLVTMLFRACKNPLTGGELNFPDAAKVSDWAKDAMVWGVKCGLISAVANGNLSPKGVASRGLVANMLRLFGNGENVLPTGLVIADAHTAAAGADFSALEKIYSGLQLTHAGMHEHSNSGKVEWKKNKDGTPKMVGSDGKFTLKQWKETLMGELGYDVVAIVDHRQVQHMYSEDWDSDLFICGTEPGSGFTDLSPQATKSSFHYAMLFDDKEDLAKVVTKFTEFEFQGTNPDPIYWGFRYPKFTKARFQELVDYVRELGGIVSMSHPLNGHNYIMSTNPEDYFLGEYTYFDTITGNGPYLEANAENYDMWAALLKNGHHLYASAIGDTHSKKYCAPITLYTTTKKSAEVFSIIKTGNYTAGFMGIKMSVGDKPMGSVAGYKAGDTLTIEVGDFFTKKAVVKPDSDYYLRVFTEKGLCFMKKINVTETTRVALTLQDRAYYRADVFNADNGYAIAIGNPIWKNELP